MVIDFHTHAFPDNLAEKAMTVLTESAAGEYIPVHDGTIAGLLKNMDNCNIDTSVVLPIVTKQSQTKNVNEWAADVNSQYSGRIICFGSIFPNTDGDNYKSDIDYIAGLGLRGLKFHAEYQNFILDDEKMLRIYDYALNKNLIIVHHAGYDPAFPAPFRSSPQQFANIIDEMQGGTIIAAHLGGHAQWDDVEKYLCGKNIYLDTSMGFEYFTQDQFLRILQNHGADKILFATDSPWSDAKPEIEHIKSLPVSESERDAILYKNAEKLLYDYM